MYCIVYIFSMKSLYKTDLKSKKLAALLVLSFIAGMGVMHEFQTREETPPKAFTKMTKIRYQQQINSGLYYCL